MGDSLRSFELFVGIEISIFNLASCSDLSQPWDRTFLMLLKLTVDWGKWQMAL